MRHAATAFVLLLAAATPACAQEHGQHQAAEPARTGADDPAARPRPAGWQVRLDRPDRGSPADVVFADMPPGFHVTTGPAAVLYHPDSTATGSYRLDAEIFLFDPGERREGYGVFFGGQDLDGAGQRYVYFLLRRDGTFLVKTRSGDETATVRDWTAHSAIRAWDTRPAGEATVQNTLAVQVGPTDVAFLVNGTEVTRVPRSELPSTDGVFGLRVNHSLNLHVTSVGATP